MKLIIFGCGKMTTQYVAVLSFAVNCEKNWVELKKRFESIPCVTNFTHYPNYWLYSAEYKFENTWIITNRKGMERHILQKFRKETKTRYKPFIMKLYQIVDGVRDLIPWEVPVEEEDGEEDEEGEGEEDIDIYSLSESRENKPTPQLNIDVSTIDLTTSEAISENDACVICKGNKKTHICVPCGHVAFCGACAKGFVEANQSSNCVICRAKIDNIIKVWY